MNALLELNQKTIKSGLQGKDIFIESDEDNGVTYIIVDDGKNETRIATLYPSTIYNMDVAADLFANMGFYIQDIVKTTEDQSSLIQGLDSALSMCLFLLNGISQDNPEKDVVERVIAIINQLLRGE